MTRIKFYGFNLSLVSTEVGNETPRNQLWPCGLIDAYKGNHFFEIIKLVEHIFVPIFCEKSCQ